jgi:hypothetical protein
MSTETRRDLPDPTRLTRAWQDGAQAVFTGYSDGLRRLSELGTTFWQPQALARPELREVVERISTGAREVTSAQVAVAGEWLRAPLWLTGSASPVDLQARYARLFEAQRGLVRAYLDAALGWQRAMTATTERVTEAAREAVDVQTNTARQVANDVREVQEAAIETAQQTTNAVRETTSRVVTQAREVAEEAAERAERERIQAERERAKAERQREREREEQERQRIVNREIKGNVSRDGEKIYHLPGQASYERTQAEETFATEAEAQAAGYRRSETRGGGTIKGHVNREGEKIYHTPGQSNYDRIDAQFLFESEEQAQASGFRAAQR